MWGTFSSSYKYKNSLLFKINFNLIRQVFNYSFFVGHVGYNVDTQLYMRGVVIRIRNKVSFLRIYAGSDYIYVYHTLEGEVGPNEEIFKLVPGSHHMRGDEADTYPEIDICLALGQTLLMDGNIMI